MRRQAELSQRLKQQDNESKNLKEILTHFSNNKIVDNIQTFEIDKKKPKLKIVGLKPCGPLCIEESGLTTRRSTAVRSSRTPKPEFISHTSLYDLHR